MKALRIKDIKLTLDVIHLKWNQSLKYTSNQLDRPIIYGKTRKLSLPLLQQYVRSGPLWILDIVLLSLNYKSYSVKISQAIARKWKDVIKGLLNFERIGIGEFLRFLVGESGWHFVFHDTFLDVFGIWGN